MNAFHVLNQFISLQTYNQYEQASQSIVVYEETKEIAGEICELKHHKQRNEDLENHCPL